MSSTKYQLGRLICGVCTNQLFDQGENELMIGTETINSIVAND